MPRIFTILLTSLLFHPSISVSSNINDLEQLLAPLQVINHVKLNYHEKRYSLFLKQPKQSKGTLEYIKPDHFIKTVKTPIQQIFNIESNQITITRTDNKTHNQSQQILSLDEYPQFKQFTALFSGLFKGDATALTQYYQYKISHKNENQILLLLTSKISDAFIQQQQIISQSIEVLFQHSEISSISMTGFGGERTLIELDRVTNND